MKFQRFLGGVFAYLGGILMLTSLIASVLPMIDNPQVRLILDSLQTRNRSVVANGLNQAMLFILRNHYPLLGTGAGLIALGVLLNRSARRGPGEASYQAASANSSGPYAVLRDKAPPPPAGRAQWQKPAYPPILAEDSPSPPVLEQEPPPAAPSPAPSPGPALAPRSRGRREANPYHAYGQRAPSVPIPPAAPIPSPSAYQPPPRPLPWPDALAARSGGEAGPPKEPLSGGDKPTTLPHTGSLSPLPYQRPKQSPTAAPPSSAPEDSPKEPAGAVLKPLPASLKPLGQEAPAPQPEEESPKPQYISQRIRSTMKRKTP